MWALSSISHKDMHIIGRSQYFYFQSGDGNNHPSMPSKMMQISITYREISMINRQLPTKSSHCSTPDRITCQNNNSIYNHSGNFHNFHQLTRTRTDKSNSSFHSCKKYQGHKLLLRLNSQPNSENRIAFPRWRSIPSKEARTSLHNPHRSNYSPLHIWNILHWHHKPSISPHKQNNLHLQYIARLDMPSRLWYPRSSIHYS